MNRQRRFAGLVIAGLALVSTEPALAFMQTISTYDYHEWYLQVENRWLMNSNYGQPYAKVVIPWGSCSSLGIVGLPRTLILSGIRVYDISVDTHVFNATTVVANVQLWRYYNNVGWLKSGQAVERRADISNNGLYNYVVLPDAIMYPQSAGYYYVTAEIKWYVSYLGVQAATGLSFNKASDYVSPGNSVPYNGY